MTKSWHVSWKAEVPIYNGVSLRYFRKLEAELLKCAWSAAEQSRTIYSEMRHNRSLATSITIATPPSGNCCASGDYLLKHTKGGWVRWGYTFFIFAIDRLIRTARDHSSEMKDETTIQIGLTGNQTWDPVRNH